MAAGTIPNPLTVLMEFEAPHSEVSLSALRHSLNRLMSTSGIAVDVQLKDDLPLSPQFGQLVIFKMKGSCSMSPMPLAALSDERGPLAMAYVSDGQVLHFGEVECDRVRHSLQRTFHSNSSLKTQQIFGSALALVIAHEVYHMLGNARQHTREGLTKSALSSSELADSNLVLPGTAIAALQKSTNP